jgi:Protein of unknown function (DUF1592)/Protein of unknown function (DUF1588)/Protein of unknown function (DUF1595)
MSITFGAARRTRSVASLGAVGLLTGCFVAACTGDIGDRLEGADGTDQVEPVGPDGPRGGGSAAEVGACDELPERRIARLPDRHYRSSVRNLLVDAALAVDFESAGSAPGELFEDLSRLPVGEALATLYQSSAETLSDVAAERVATLLPCPSSTTTANACVRDWLQSFVGRAYRRPPSAEELADYAALFEAGSTEGAASGLRLVVQAVLQAPSFLYRTELGIGAEPAAAVALTDYEVASQLSFWLLDAPPDAGLLAAAAGGTLSDPARLRAEVERLLALSSTQELLTQAHLRWFRLTTLTSQTKDESLFPTFASARASLLESARRSIAEALWTGSGDMSALYTSQNVNVDANVAPFFGLPAPASHGFARVQAPPERKGLLTHPALLARYGSATQGQIVQRGAFVAKDVLCLPLTSPPAGLDIKSPGAGLTQREFASYRARTSACTGCHAFMDPFGLAMTAFDAVGRYQPVQDGARVETASQVVGTDFDGSISGPVDLATRIAESRLTSVCTVVHMMSLGLTRRLDTESCGVQRMTEAFVAKGRTLSGLVAEIALSNEFRMRRGD